LVRISLDFDGVIGNTVELWLKKYNEKYGKNLQYKDIDHWRFGDIVGLTNEQVLDIFELCWSDWRGLKPMEKNQFHTVEAMKLIGRVDIVTAVHVQFIPIVKKWLSNYNIDCKIIQSREKEKLKYDVYIDDSPENAKAIVEMGKTCILYNQPWNQGVEGKGIIRVYSLTDALGVLRRREYLQEEIQKT